MCTGDTDRWSGGDFGIGKRESMCTRVRTNAFKSTHPHTHCNCPCYSGALRCIVWLWSRINGGRGIRVNLLGTHGPGFVSKPHFGFVEGNGNDMGAKQENTFFIYVPPNSVFFCFFFFK